MSGSWVNEVLNYLHVRNPSWTVEKPDPVDQQLLSGVDPVSDRRKPILVRSDGVESRAPNQHPPPASTSWEYMGVAGTSESLPPAQASVPPRGEARVPNVHVVPLDSEVGQRIVQVVEGRGQDEHKDPKYHLTHQGMLLHAPELVLKHIWDVVKQGGGYVVWNYTDFYNHFATWTGSYTGLLTNIQFMWRALVTAVLTIGLLEILPLIEGLGRLLWDIFYVVRAAFGLIERAVDELFVFLTILWDDMASLVQKLTG